MEEPGAGQTDWEQQLAKLWERRRPRIMDRVAVLETLAAAEEPRAGEIEEGRVEAHKLRGLLGTIGLPAGSEAAGEIEDRLADGNVEIAEPLAQLSDLVRTHEPG